jgi:hypothetical protein
MKTFQEYLKESIQSKKYPFRVKVAGEFTAEQEGKLKSMLDRFKIDTFKKVGTTPIQALPLDFPQVRNCEVSIYEVTLDYPTTQQELTEYISSGLNVNKSHLAVRSPNEPTEEYQHQEPKREGALLDDPDYKESPNAQFEDYYGDKYNTGFVKELNDILKLQRKARGEEIPTEGAAKYNTDSPQNNKAPVEQAPETRK